MRICMIGMCILSLVSLVGCNKTKVEGTYKLDKAEMEKFLNEKIASAPETQRPMIKLHADIMRSMDVTLVLTHGGRGEMKSILPDLFGKGEPKTKAEMISWELKGNELTISGGKKPLKCSLDAGRIICSDGKDRMVFVKG